MFLIVGIGNIGKKYSGTRHNVGFMFVDKICESFGLGSFSNRFLSDICIGTCDVYKTHFMKPKTYVNLSGNAVKMWKDFYKKENDSIFVFYDDLGLPLGKVKITKEIGSGGHNGIKSINSAIGGGYNRIRIGLKDTRYQKDSLKDVVLSNLSKEEKNIVSNVINIFIENINFLFSNNEKSFSHLMSIINKDAS